MHGYLPTTPLAMEMIRDARLRRTSLVTLPCCIDTNYIIIISVLLKSRIITTALVLPIDIGGYID